jgi:hypothetical protein
VREQLRKRLTAVEEERTLLAQQVEQLQIVVKERDDLNVQLRGHWSLVIRHWPRLMTNDE